jgi:hypothetical protein
MSTGLTAERVEALFEECIRDDGTEIEGILHKVKLNVAGHEDDIRAMLAELPPEFQHSGGGGWSFLQACETRGGVQWTGLHATMEKLFMLGMAAGAARWLLPRELWEALPGGMPYVSVN